jgi:predicted transcriptional regulator
MANTTSLKLPDELKEKVTELAQGVAQTPHAYMVEAIAEKVERDGRRREFLEAGLEAQARFKRTGVVYSHKEVIGYVRKLAAGKKVRKPKPIRIPRTER